MNTQATTPFPIQPKISQRVDTSDPTNKAVLEKEVVLTLINSEYADMAKYLIAVYKDKDEKTSDRMKALSTLLSLQEKILKEFNSDDQKTKQVREGGKSEDQPSPQHKQIKLQNLTQEDVDKALEDLN